MRTPPPVSIDDVSARNGWRGVQAALYALGAAALAAWAGGHLHWEPSAWAIALSGGLAAGAIGWALSRAPAARLRWTGAQWLLRVADDHELPVMPPAVMLDSGAWMLLRCSGGDAGSRWLAVSRSAAGAEWPHFRAAVYSAAPGLSSAPVSERLPF
jgi:hypothetical protein